MTSSWGGLGHSRPHRGRPLPRPPHLGLISRRAVRLFRSLNEGRFDVTVLANRHNWKTQNLRKILYFFFSFLFASPGLKQGLALAGRELRAPLLAPRSLHFSMCSIPLNILRTPTSLPAWRAAALRLRARPSPPCLLGGSQGRGGTGRTPCFLLEAVEAAENAAAHLGCA